MTEGPKGNVGFGVSVEQPAGATVCNIEDCVIVHNGNGIAAQNGAPTVRLSNSTVINNTVGILLSGGTVASFGNNRIAGNGSGNDPTGGANIPLK